MGFPSPGSWRSPAARPRGLQVDLKLFIPHLFIQAVFGVPTGYQVLCCPPGSPVLVGGQALRREAGPWGLECPAGLGGGE